jgi:hypothetical protein
VLSQLGNRVQHALRAFTPDDAENLRKTARTFPMTDSYDVERDITRLGIGEAFVTVLGPKGVPTPLAWTRLIPPDSRMAPLTAQELQAAVASSPLASRYNTPVDRESAHELISARIANAKAAAAQATGMAIPGAATPGSASTNPPAMSPAEYEREIKRRAKELEAQRKAEEREQKAEERARRADERQRQKTIETSIRTAGRVVTSRTGQSIIRGIFDTIFGKRR